MPNNTNDQQLQNQQTWASIFNVAGQFLSGLLQQSSNPSPNQNQSQSQGQAQEEQEQPRTGISTDWYLVGGALIFIILLFIIIFKNGKVS